MAKMKIEVLAARAERHGIGARETLVAELPRYAPFATRLAPLANLRNAVPLLRRMGERWLGVAAARRLPVWRRDFFRDAEAADLAPAKPRGEVLLLADTFNRYFEPENLRAALRVLAAAGYRASVPVTRGRPLCCGRTFLAAGLVEQARAEAGRTMRRLAGTLPVIGLEPSCLFTLRDELRSLHPGAEAEALSRRAMLLAEFLAREKIELPLRPLVGTAHVHGHCHQKSFGAFPASIAMLKQVPDLAVKPIASSCCGMAGSFGYQAETQDVSRAMAEASLLPAVRAAAADDIIVADGTSCRHQIRDLAGREAVHSVRVLERALG
jgi:Fe-S oxidoreductase